VWEGMSDDFEKWCVKQKCCLLCNKYIANINYDSEAGSQLTHSSGASSWS
jgi:hypothetical protein